MMEKDTLPVKQTVQSWGHHLTTSVIYFWKLFWYTDSAAWCPSLMFTNELQKKSPRLPGKPAAGTECSPHTPSAFSLEQRRAKVIPGAALQRRHTGESCESPLAQLVAAGAANLSRTSPRHRQRRLSLLTAGRVLRAESRPQQSAGRAQQHRQLELLFWEGKEQCGCFMPRKCECCCASTGGICGGCRAWKDQAVGQCVELGWI